MSINAFFYRCTDLDATKMASETALTPIAIHYDDRELILAVFEIERPPPENTLHRVYVLW
jgi:hypothetical protein